MKDIKRKSDGHQFTLKVVFCHDGAKECEIDHTKSHAATRKDPEGWIWQLTSWLPLYAGWEESCMAPANLKQPEAV